MAHLPFDLALQSREETIIKGIRADGNLNFLERRLDATQALVWAEGLLPPVILGIES
jgi:predicted RNase H-like nuclease